MAIREKIAVRENGLIMVSEYMIPNCSSKVTHKVRHNAKKIKKIVLLPDNRAEALKNPEFNNRLGHGRIEEPLNTTDTRRMSELTESLRLNLANSLTRNVELAPHFL